MAIAGQVAMVEHGELVGPGDPVAPTERVFENLELALAEVGLGARLFRSYCTVEDFIEITIVGGDDDREFPTPPPTDTAVTGASPAEIPPSTILLVACLLLGATAGWVTLRARHP